MSTHYVIKHKSEALWFKRFSGHAGPTFIGTANVDEAFRFDDRAEALWLKLCSDTLSEDFEVVPEPVS